MARRRMVMGQQKSGKIRRLGVLTGGGDVPGLNAAIKAIVYRAEPLGIEVVGLRAGWEGITYLNRERKIDELTFKADREESWAGGYLMPLTRSNTRTIDRAGGTVLQSTRTNPSRVKVTDLPAHLATSGEGRSSGEHVDLTGEVLANLDYLALDGLVVIGGDDTLSYAARLKNEGACV